MGSIASLDSQEALAVDDQKFRNDSVSITIVEENDLAQTHQDFFDAAQVRPCLPRCSWSMTSGKR